MFIWNKAKIFKFWLFFVCKRRFSLMSWFKKTFHRINNFNFHIYDTERSKNKVVLFQNNMFSILQIEVYLRCLKNKSSPFKVMWVNLKIYFFSLFRVNLKVVDKVNDLPGILPSLMVILFKISLLKFALFVLDSFINL